MASSKRFLARAVRRAGRRFPGAEPAEAPEEEPADRPAETPPAPVGEAGLVSVVVAATDAHREFLGECLDSLQAQSHRKLQVLLLPYGSCAEVTQLADTLASEDERLEVSDEVFPDLTSARRIGAERAGGEYLTFVGAGDRLPPRAVASLVASLKKSGSEFAVGNVSQPRSVGRTRAAELRNNENAHKAAQVVDAPEVVVDTAVEARLFRTAFWRRCGLGLSDDGRSLLSVPLLSALLGGARFDVLTKVAYQSLGRGEGAPLGQQPVVMPGLTGWLTTQHQVARLLEGANALRDAWLLHVLDVDVIPFLDDVERADHEQWKALSTGVRDLLDSATPEVWAQVRSESRVKVWLAAHDRRPALEDFVVSRWHTAGNKPTLVERGTVYAKMLFFRDAAVGVPNQCYVMTPAETPLRASLRRARWGFDDGLELQVFALIDFVDMTDETPTLTATLVDRAHGLRVPVAVQQAIHPAVTRYGGRRFQAFDAGAFTLTVDARRLVAQLRDVPADPDEVSWELELALRVRGVERVAVLSHVDAQGSAAMTPPRELSSWTVTLQPRADRTALLHTARPQAAEPAEDLVGPHLTAFHLEQDALVFTGLWHDDAPESWSMHLEDDRGSVAGAITKIHDTFMVRFPLSQSRWGRPELPLPSGTYRLRLDTHDGGGTPYEISLDQELADLLPVEELSSSHRVKVFRTGSGAVAVRLSAPLTDEELGPYRQQQLQDWFTSADHTVDEKAVYFQSYVGQVATDSPLAIHEELHRTRPDLTLYWGVADHSTVLPEGAVPVLINSRRWYEVLATSKYLVSNVDFDPWFRKQPGQRFLETFHGYPAKSMGLRLFEGKQFTPRRIDLELERTAKKWDLILTPTPEMDQYYREEYRYDGEIHNLGYPRDDVLTSPEAELIRHETRRVLGIAEGKTVVLYAPTWRDHLATKHYSAKMAKYLDVEAAADALGDDYVLLLRGHRFHASGNERAKATARILDVTDYPEINDLILAADVGVLDYSSLRFDFGLTGKPMVFLVPDLGLYTGRARGFLFDYHSTAPGPLLDTGDEVVAALQHLDRLEAAYADARKRFVEQYHRWQDGHATKRVVAAFFE